MGPILVCDKSTLQGLGRGELNVLRRYYSLNIPPVLLAEILGDLKKQSDASMSKEEVRQLADKLVPACSTVNVDFRQLVRGELAGNKVPMDGRPVMGGGKHVISSDGKSGMVFDHTPDAEALLRWQNGEFKEAEEILAETWRRATQSIDLESTQRQLRHKYSGQINLRTLADAAQFVDGLMASAPAELLLAWFVRDAGLDPAREQNALEALQGSTRHSLQALAPYTAHCIRIGLIFQFALAFGLIGTRPTNRIDLEYLYYAPFCHAFSSGDAFHRKTAHLTLRADQTFVERDELKLDLRKLAEWWRGLNENQREEECSRQGPPENEISVTHQLWSKVMRPGYRNPQRLSQEAQRKMLKEIKEHVATGLPTKQTLQGSLDDCDFVVIKHHVRASGPCICGSEKSFKDCCGRGLAGTKI